MSAQRFKLLRLKKKMTQRQFAELLGVSESTVAAIENGRRPISDHIRVSLAEQGGVDEDFLYFLESLERVTQIYPR